MNRLVLSLVAAAAGIAGAPKLASALPAVTTDSTDLRAGPASDFPVVDRIPSDVRVTVHGCVRAYRWCDISWRDARGWVPGDELAYLDHGRRVTIVEYGPRIGLPIIAFSFDTYWDHYYRGRSWYGERARWRTVWREHDHGDGRSSAHVKERRDSNRAERRSEDRTDVGKMERTDRAHENKGREAEHSDQSGKEMNHEGRSSLRSGEMRGYKPPRSSGGADRGTGRESTSGPGPGASKGESGGPGGNPGHRD
jgi:uncharacterized protein YraI